MIEVQNRIEFPLHHGMKEVEEMSNMHDILVDYGSFVSAAIMDSFRGNSSPALVVPLLGSIVPLRYALHPLQNKQGVYGLLKPHIICINTTKIGDTAQIMSSHEQHHSFQPTLIIEDILDEGGTAEVLERCFSMVTTKQFIPVLVKPESLELARKRLTNTTVSISPDRQIPWEIPNLWVAGGGMDAGPKKLNGKTDEDNAILAVTQRLSAKGFAFEGKALPPYQEQLALFDQYRFPWVSDELREIMIEMELQKMCGDQVALIGNTGRLLDAIEETF